ncbi:MAG TPA: hypothetical protein VG273_10950, partial [Bryobacteraceae bacterium]|nr:hypothetical protein [Bryobacteraceae bacterium]
MTYTNRNNAYGETTDRPNYTPGCEVVTGGNVESRLLNGYINASCFSAPSPLVASSTATGFGNAPVGQIAGPDQFNIDLAILKRFRLPFAGEASNLEFRTEMFNAFNHPQFANPSTTFNTATFGIDTNG